MSFPEDPNAPRPGDRYKGLPVLECGHVECPFCDAHNDVNVHNCTVCGEQVHASSFGIDRDNFGRPMTDAERRGDQWAEGTRQTWREKQRAARDEKLRQITQRTIKDSWKEESERTDPAFQAEVEIGVDRLLDYVHEQERKGY